MPTAKVWARKGPILLVNSQHLISGVSVGREILNLNEC